MPLKPRFPLVHSYPYGRRRFLQAASGTVAALTLANCRTNLTGETTTPRNPSGDGKDTLHIYTWSNYIDQDMVRSFTERTGLKVIFDIFDSNEVMLTKLQSGGGNAYSLIYPSDYMVSQMVDLAMLTALDADRLPGIKNLKSRWANPGYDPNNAHSVPFSTGTTGLIYNREATPGVPEDWEFLWQARPQISRRFTLLDDTREVLGATLKSLGYSYNTNDATQIEAAYRKLLALKPHIAAFKTGGFEDEILAGDLAVAMAYSADAIPLTRQDTNLAYQIPGSGTSLWTDTMAIPATAPNPEAAYQWINFMLEPEIARVTAERFFLGTVNQAAFEQLPPELKNNRDLYPEEEVLDRSEGIAPLATASNDLFDRFWTEITSA
ncbi:MAG: spermidine/putrescine ABC transporter substrate-binding protein [Cyanobacteriota bacterium]|nr:spermidine/putrescine ABC transporter substrate-binding protein [Cyanobacteriota bacterium]